MNLKNFYTEKQTADLLSISTATLRRHRPGLGAIQVGQKYFYQRRNVEDYAYANLSNGELKHFERTTDKIKAHAVATTRAPQEYETYDVSLEEYAPVREVYEYFPWSRQALDSVVGSDQHHIGRIKILGQWMYYKPHLKEYLLTVSAQRMREQKYPYYMVESTTTYSSFEEWETAVKEW